MTHNNSMPLETWQQRTGGGGIQMFFTYPENWKFAVNAKTDINVDIRCQGGFAVLPPTLHASGANYVWEAGLAPWEIEILAAPDWLLEEVERLVREHGHVSRETYGENPPQNGAGLRHTAGQFDAFGHQTDGRETFMRDLIWGAVVDWFRERPAKPSDAESRHKAGEKYLVYEAQVSPQGVHPIGTKKTDALEAEGRGTTEFWVKWTYAMGQWDTKVAEEANKPGSKRENRANFDYTDEFRADPKNVGDAPVDIFELLSIADLKALPDPQWLVQGMVVEQALGFIFGPPSSLKTFIALGMALSLTTGKPTWWGRSIQRKGAVLYICSEGIKSLKFRISAWELHHKTPADAAPFAVIRQNINFMEVDDVNKLLRTVQAAQASLGPIAAVFVDTVSRVLPGAEENLQKDMTMFVAACDAVRQLFGATVIGLHHTNANGGFRGSTVMPGAGDFLVEVRREPGANAGSIYATKIKDDEDGWEQTFTVIEVPLPGIVPRTSLVVESEAIPDPRNSGNRERANFDVREQIMRALDKAWCDGKPWSHQPNSPRSGVNAIIQTWGLDRKAAKEILDKWLGKGLIEEDTYSKKLRIKGYRKLKDL
jgi:hypothetical protein